MTQPGTQPTPPWEPDATGVPADATAEQLAELATTRPDLWPEITAHPNGYDGLRSWIAANRAMVEGSSFDADATMTAASFEEATRTVAASDFEQTAIASDVEHTTVAGEAMPQFAPPASSWRPQGSAPQDVAHMPPPPQTPVSHYPAPAGFGPPPLGAGSSTFAAAPDPGPGPRPKSKLTRWIAGGVAAALVLAGGGVALALTDTWPFGENGLGVAGGAAASQASQQDAGPTFADGVAQKWTVDGTEFGDFATVRGHMPRMMPLVAQRDRPDQPILLDGSVLFSYETNAAASRTGWAAVDPATGATLWSTDTDDRRASCAARSDGQEATCTMSALSGPGSMVRLDSEGMQTIHDFGANWESSNRLWYEGEDVAVLDREGYRVMSSQGDFDADAAVPRPSGNPLASPEETGLAEGGCGWLVVDGVISYFGSACDAESDEVVSDAARFEWAVMAGGSPRIILSETDRVTAFDAKTREQLWSKPGVLPGWYQAPQIVKRDSGDGVLVWNEAQQSVAIVDVETGDQVKIATAADDRHLAVSGGQVLAFSGDSDRSLSSVEVFDGETGDELYAGTFPEVTEVAEVVGGPNGVLFSHYFCDDCTTAEGSHSIDRYTFMGPANSDSGTAQAAGSVSIPDTITIGCPADTILLAWGEFADGWVLVCGVSKTEPTFMAYQGPGSAKVLYSVGAQNPTGADAKAAVDWDAGLSRYTAEIDGGDRVTLDYDIGTAVLRDSADHKTLEQQRFVRYVFVPLGESVRTMSDTSQEDGAFDVQAPDDTADDQVRYMIEVLEKAYSGRALVKDALPKLEYCTASAGGYGDTVAAMKAVRDNRAELLSSLDAMPVDRIPEGSALLDDLYEAIEASYRANVEYVAWAEAANESGCASLSSRGALAAASSDAPKERFASRWNRAVAPKFGVRTFDAWYI